MDAAACGRQDLREKESSVFQKLKSGDIFLYFFKPYRFVRAVFSTPAVTLSCRNIYPVTIEHLSTTNVMCTGFQPRLRTIPSRAEPTLETTAMSTGIRTCALVSFTICGLFYFFFFFLQMKSLLV
jgi:hypothetical protein